MSYTAYDARSCVSPIARRTLGVYDASCCFGRALGLAVGLRRLRQLCAFKRRAHKLMQLCWAQNTQAAVFGPKLGGFVWPRLATFKLVWGRVLGAKRERACCTVDWPRDLSNSQVALELTNQATREFADRSVRIGDARWLPFEAEAEANATQRKSTRKFRQISTNFQAQSMKLSSAPISEVRASLGCRARRFNVLLLAKLRQQRSNCTKRHRIG